jgi:hypothetical protein
VAERDDDERRDRNERAAALLLALALALFELDQQEPLSAQGSARSRSRCSRAPGRSYRKAHGSAFWAICDGIPIAEMAKRINA